jgi:hypothetical protein
MDFFNFGGRSRVSDETEKVIEITSRGKNALKAGTVDGIEADILDMMKGGAPFTVQVLADRLNQKYTFVRTGCKALSKKRFIEVIE